MVLMGVGVLLLVFAMEADSVVGNPVSSTSGLQRFSRAHFEFSLDLYAVLAAQNPASVDGEAANLLFSPYSISAILAMIFLGKSWILNYDLSWWEWWCKTCTCYFLVFKVLEPVRILRCSCARLCIWTTSASMTFTRRTKRSWPTWPTLITRTASLPPVDSSHRMELSSTKSTAGRHH